MTRENKTYFQYKNTKSEKPCGEDKLEPSWLLNPRKYTIRNLP